MSKKGHLMTIDSNVIAKKVKKVSMLHVVDGAGGGTLEIFLKLSFDSR